MPKRNHNLDYLRLLAIFMIVVHHTYLQMAAHYATSTISRAGQWGTMVVGSGGKIGVNLFMLITGYFLIKRTFKLRRLVNFAARTYFISAVIVVVALFLAPISIGRALIDLLTPIFPFDGPGWWYVTGYAIVLLLSPVINLIFRQLSQKQATWLVGGVLLFTSVLPWLNIQTQTISLTATNGGLWMICMYMVGGYLSLYPLSRVTVRQWWTLLIGGFLVMILRFAVLIWSPAFLSIPLRLLGWSKSIPWTDHDPVILLVSVAAFELALLLPSLGMPRWLQRLAGETLALYMLHNSNPVSIKYRGMFYNMIDWQHWHSWQFVVFELAAALLVFAVVVVITLLIAPLEDRFAKWAVQRVHKRTGID